MATHRETGKRYVGFTRRTLAQRKNEHERDAGQRGRPFHEALRLCGPDAFTWLAVAEGEAEVIKLLERL